MRAVVVFVLAASFAFCLLLALLYKEKRRELRIKLAELEKERARIEARSSHLHKLHLSLQEQKRQYENAREIERSKLTEAWEKIRFLRTQYEKERQKLGELARNLERIRTGTNPPQPEEKTDKAGEAAKADTTPDPSHVRRAQRNAITEESSDAVNGKMLPPGTGRVTGNQKGPIFTERSKKVHIQVGLDFGTSCTKVVFSNLGNRFRIINFNHDLPHYPQYVIPSVATVDSSGKLRFGAEAAMWLSEKEWDYGFRRFKMLVAGNIDKRFEDQLTREKFSQAAIKSGLDQSVKPDVITALYLAHVMRTVRSIIAEQLSEKASSLDLAFNICVPIDQCEEEHILSAFKQIFEWAELIERKWPTPTKSTDPLELAYKLRDVQIDMDEKRVFPVPESVASLASYTVSLRKREGIHALIDFGSGTTDLSICNVMMPFDKTEIYWYSTRNIPFGTISIERDLACHLESRRKIANCSYSQIRDLLLAVANNEHGRAGLNETRTFCLSAIQRQLQQLWSSKPYKDTWGHAYSHYRKSSVWESVHVFVSGGGARLPHIRQIFSQPWWRNIRSQYPVELIPKPGQYNDKLNAPFERMAVAYGLAIPQPMLEKYKLPKEAPNHTPAPLPEIDLHHEDMYLK